MLKVVVNGIRLFGALVLSTSRFDLEERAAFSLRFSVFWRGYPRSLKRFSRVAMASLAWSLVEHIFWALRNCPYGILWICLGGWYDWKWRYAFLSVGLLYRLVERVPSGFSVMRVSRKLMLCRDWLHSNLMDVCASFSSLMNFSGTLPRLSKSKIYHL